jgi:hypothetical protein
VRASTSDPVKLIPAPEMRRRMGLKKTLFYKLCEPGGPLPAIRFSQGPGSGIFFREIDVDDCLRLIVEAGHKNSGLNR